MGNKLIDAIDYEIPVYPEDQYERGYTEGLEMAIRIVESLDGVAVERCENCPNFRAYVNAKIGRGLCIYMMHEMPVDGYCSERSKED